MDARIQAEATRDGMGFQSPGGNGEVGASGGLEFGAAGPWKTAFTQ